MRGCILQVSEEPGLEQTGRCGSRVLVPEDDWASPSICCARTIFLPCQSCICISVTCCSGPAYSSHWLVPPHQFSCSPCYPNLSWTPQIFSQRSGWDLQQLDQPNAGNRLVWLPHSEGNASTCCLRRPSPAASCTSPCSGGVVEELGRGVSSFGFSQLLWYFL